MAVEIDPRVCSDLLSKMSDEIAAKAPSSALDRSVVEAIAEARAVSEAAGQGLRAALADIYPGIQWVDEEERPADSDYWLCDPIDGAYHFLQGLPLWSSSLVLIRAGAPFLSVVHDATRRETFLAVKSGGASCNGRSISVSPKSDLSAAVVGTAIPPLAQVGETEQEQALAMLAAVAKAAFVIRPMAAVSLQLAYVAAGRLDAYWENGRDAADWLAGSLLVREAQGVVTHLHGGSFGWSGKGIVAGNRELHTGLQRIISSGA
jgi:myo-inositol-1(or 4)-monophosphatase